MFTGVQTDNTFTMLDQIVHAGKDGFLGGPQTHSPYPKSASRLTRLILIVCINTVHTQDEGMYVVSGQCTFNAGGHDGMVAPPGSFVNVPRNTEHSFSVDHPNTQLLNFYLPAGFEQLLVGIAHPATENTPPPPGVPLPPPQLVYKLAADYGQTAVLGMPFAEKPDKAKMWTKPTPGNPLTPHVRSATQSSAYFYRGGLWSVLADSAETGRSYDICEVSVAAGASSPPAMHQRLDEMYYVLEGQVTFLLGDRVETAGKHAAIFIPRGTPFAWRAGQEKTRFLNMHTPSGFERVLEVCGSPAKERVVPEPVRQDPEVADVAKQITLGEIGMRELAVANPLA